MLDLRDMSRAQVLRLAVVVATILAVALASAVLAAAALADDGEETDDDATAPPALQPTQIIADIPDGYGELFPLQWGGGSLHHLKGRLATMGCTANTLWLYDNDRWRPYNHYDVPRSFFYQFLDAYEAFVPPGTLWADCIQLCALRGECRSYEDLREQNPNPFSWIPHFSFADPCTEDFDPRVKEQVFPVLPLPPRLCIQRERHPAGFGHSGLAYWDSWNTPPVIAVFTGRDVYRNSKERDVIRLKLEIHELCHINQFWQAQVDTDRGNYPYTLSEGPQNFESGPLNWEFKAVVGLETNGWEWWEWSLPPNSVYRDIYSVSAEELNAELCAMYLLDMMGMRSSYDYEKWDADKGYYEVPIRRVNVNKYLTPEVRAWLEQWMILPQIDDD